MWKAVVLERCDDDDKLVYHAYAVSEYGVHDREGKYRDQEAAMVNAISYANILNIHQVSEVEPCGEKPLKKEQGKKPWILKSNKPM